MQLLRKEGIVYKKTITVTSLNEKLMHKNDTDKKLQNLDDVCSWQKRDSNSCNEIKILS